MSARPNRPVALLLATERLATGAALALGCVAMTIAACAGLFQVLTRFILQEPATWSEPLIRMMLIWMAYLGLAAAVRAGSLISVDLLYRLVRGRQRRALEAMIALATLVLLGVLVWFGIDLTNRVRFQNLAGLEIPVSFAYAAIPTGALISMLAVVAHFFDPRREELDTAV
ncbi:TRAP transporter small permease [Bosea psychrotolerans]|uniref:TRAP transporter small permease protein n=1 Tax=Bosea psychrotolerans TaxID=1871628 RepID=A0A2S4MCU0_9HYPH|nr:TRAP transporter small permease [Bosea psychrotolerans]POR52573.1 TRAP-type C4-dicarboxylate transport system permease small subunit [Bosea psychrotolerans]